MNDENENFMIEIKNMLAQTLKLHLDRKTFTLILRNLRNIFKIVSQPEILTPVF